MEIKTIIESLRHCTISEEGDCRSCPSNHHDSGCLDRLHVKAAAALESQQKRIAELETQNRWIPVTERLPEEDERIEFYDDGRMRCTTVLAYTEYGRIIPKNRLIIRPTGNKYLDTQVTDGWIWASGTEEVTHWQSMPKPPKEVEVCR